MALVFLPVCSLTEAHNHETVVGRIWPACVVQHRSHATGALARLYQAEQAGIGVGPEKARATACEQHGAICGHATVALARYHLSNPAGWCENCRESTAARAS